MDPVHNFNLDGSIHHLQISSIKWLLGFTNYQHYLKSLLHRPQFTTYTSSSSSSSSSLSSSSSSCLVKFPPRNSILTTTAPTCRSSISARYGGGGGGGGGSRYDSRQPRQSTSEEDPALDLSSVRSGSVRLIDDKQNMIGVVSKSEAIRMADEAELDLVILSPEADPPVLRMMDYTKYKYEAQKKKREQQKKSAANRMDLKELKMGYNIDTHDYSVRLRAALKFLKDGDKVKIIVNLKGREQQFRNNAIELIKRFQNDVGELAVEESKSFRDRNMSIIMVPNKVTVPTKSPDPPKKKEGSSDSEIPAAL